MYAQQDMTDEEREHIRVISSPEYDAGFKRGYDMALAVHGMVEAAQ